MTIPKHTSHDTTVVAPHNDAKLSSSLRRSDDVDPRGDIWQLRSATPGGGRIFADAYLSLEDVRTLQVFLSRYEGVLVAEQFVVPADEEASPSRSPAKAAVRRVK